MKKKLVILSLVIFALFSCEDPYIGTTFKVNDLNPVASYLDSRSDEFSEWITVLKYADLYNALNQATQSFTAFVPDNNAVKRFYANKEIGRAHV